MNVKYVPVEALHQYWDKVQGYLQAGLEKTNGEYELAHIKVYLATGLQSLYVAEEDGEIKGAASVNFINYPNHRIAYIISLGGKMVANPETWSNFAELLKLAGATKCQGCTLDSTARLWESKTGFRKIYSVVEKDI